MDVLYSVAKGAFYPGLRYGLRWAIEGAEHIPTSGPVILASNHISYLDPLTLESSALDGPLRIAAADLDDDGDRDLVSVNGLTSNATVFWNLGAESFSAQPTVVGGPETTLNTHSGYALHKSERGICFRPR